MADIKKRIEDLINENIKLDQFIQQRQQELQQIIQKKLENIGRLKELDGLLKEQNNG